MNDISINLDKKKNMTICLFKYWLLSTIQSFTNKKYYKNSCFHIIVYMYYHKPSIDCNSTKQLNKNILSIISDILFKKINYKSIILVILNFIVTNLFRKCLRRATCNITIKTIA